MTSSPLARLAPFLFVFFWSTGFVGAKFGLPYAEPFTFLLVRMVITSLILGTVLLILGKAWPETPRQSGHIALSGVLIHAGYLGGIFMSIHLGLPAGLAALIAGLQPLMTAFAAQPVLGEQVSFRQWVGMVLGLLGISLVLGEKLAFDSETVFDGFGPMAIFSAVFAVCAITASSLYQKKNCAHMPLMSGTFIQYSAAALVYLVLALSFDTMKIQWTEEFVFALFWLIFVPSFGGITLLMWMIRHGEASKVASLFYLVPPLTALEAFFLFDEQLGLAAVTGMTIACLGVWMALRKSQRRP